MNMLHSTDVCTYIPTNVRMCVDVFPLQLISVAMGMVTVAVGCMGTVQDSEERACTV